MESTFISATILLILITDPLGNIPLFISALKQVKPERRRRVVYRECLIAFCVLLAFMFGGQTFLKVMHLSDESLSVAGGVILFLIAIKMIFPGEGGVLGGDKVSGEPFIVPIAIPLIAGPSAMATVLLMATREPDRMLEWVGALLISILVTTVVFLFSNRLQKWLGEQAITALERLMGLVLTAISIEMLLGGVAAYIRQFS
ncbi:MarC family protein [Craterilacuibacter sp. RT1T]|uniref:MarC family protein n=1 Tax=Craterilacuibacter sp. RT1T TaxID=2942211 RepID=UPI0020BECE7C|nr:MarC family protein [Craterilacuibacter sp. RT1T]MCL6261878.1 NAAT family transporter [Craterilacuibacter sp. RT1T]